MFNENVSQKLCIVSKSMMNKSNHAHQLSDNKLMLQWRMKDDQLATKI
jgi:hypothetical protein